MRVNSYGETHVSIFTLPLSVLIPGTLGLFLFQITPITYDTPVALILLVGVAGGMFIIGSQLQQIRDRLSSLERRMNELPCDTKNRCPDEVD